MLNSPDQLDLATAIHMNIVVKSHLNETGRFHVGPLKNVDNFKPKNGNAVYFACSSSGSASW